LARDQGNDPCQQGEPDLSEDSPGFKRDYPVRPESHRKQSIRPPGRVEQIHSHPPSPENLTAEIQLIAPRAIQTADGVFSLIKK